MPSDTPGYQTQAWWREHFSDFEVDVFEQEVKEFAGPLWSLPA